MSIMSVPDTRKTQTQTMTAPHLKQKVMPPVGTFAVNKKKALCHTYTHTHTRTHTGTHT